MNKLDTLIHRMQREYPSLFAGNRNACLEHLYYVIGNGYGWKNGEIVSNCYEQLRPRTLKGHLAAALRDPARHLFAELLFKKPTEKAICAHIEEEVREEWKSKSLAKNHVLYPLCEYSLLCSIPDNVKPEFLKGAQEAAALSKIYTYDSQKNKTWIIAFNKKWKSKTHGGTGT